MRRLVSYLKDRLKTKQVGGVQSSGLIITCHSCDVNHLLGP
jgi:hypothetical protein